MRDAHHMIKFYIFGGFNAENATGITTGTDMTGGNANVEG